MVRTGQYREQIKLLFPGSTESDGIGGWTSTGEGTEVATWARIVQLKGSQLLALGKEIDSQVFKISIRYRVDAQGADRISWKGETMKIISQSQDEKRTGITIYAVNVS